MRWNGRSSLPGSGPRRRTVVEYNPCRPSPVCSLGPRTSALRASTCQQCSISPFRERTTSTVGCRSFCRDNCLKWRRQRQREEAASAAAPGRRRPASTRRGGTLFREGSAGPHGGGQSRRPSLAALLNSRVGAEVRRDRDRPVQSLHRARIAARRESVPCPAGIAATVHASPARRRRSTSGPVSPPASPRETGRSPRRNLAKVVATRGRIALRNALADGVCMVT